jgi:hypothetical protein
MEYVRKNLPFLIGLAIFIFLAWLVAGMPEGRSPSLSPEKRSCASKNLNLEKSEERQARYRALLNRYTAANLIQEISKVSATKMEVQVTPRFVEELSWDEKLAVGALVFYLNFDGSDDSQIVVFADFRNRESLGHFDACHSLVW